MTDYTIIIEKGDWQLLCLLPGPAWRGSRRRDGRRDCGADEGSYRIPPGWFERMQSSHPSADGHSQKHKSDGLESFHYTIFCLILCPYRRRQQPSGSGSWSPCARGPRPSLPDRASIPNPSDLPFILCRCSLEDICRDRKCESARPACLHRPDGRRTALLPERIKSD